MKSVEIDFDVYKELTMRRKTEEVTYNDVIRGLLGLPTMNNTKNDEIVNNKLSWVSKGVVFPEGTEFRSYYKGQYYYAKVENGSLVYEGKQYSSPSAAAKAITNNLVNGWIFWECKLSENNSWVTITSLRNK